MENLLRSLANLILVFGLLIAINGSHFHRDDEFEREIDQTTPSVQRKQKQLLHFMVSGKDFESDLIKMSDMNPQLSIFYRSSASDLNEEKTEVIHHNPNPNWVTTFKFQWYGDVEQTWEVKVRSVDNGRATPIGNVNFKVKDYLEATEKQGFYRAELTNGNGVLIFRKADVRVFKLSARSLAKADTFGGKSDPYVICYWKQGPDGTDVEFHQTPWIGNVVDVEWMENIVFSGYISGTDQYFHFKVYDDDGITSDDFLGEAFLKLDDVKVPSRRVLDLQREPSNNSGKGRLIVEFVEVMSDTGFKGQQSPEGDSD